MLTRNVTSAYHGEGGGALRASVVEDAVDIKDYARRCVGRIEVTLHHDGHIDESGTVEGGAYLHRLALGGDLQEGAYRNTSTCQS